VFRAENSVVNWTLGCAESLIKTFLTFLYWNVLFCIQMVGDGRLHDGRLLRFQAK